MSFCEICLQAKPFTLLISVFPLIQKKKIRVLVVIVHLILQRLLMVKPCPKELKCDVEVCI